MAEDGTTHRMDAIQYNVHKPFQEKPNTWVCAVAKKLALPVHLMLFNLDGNMNIAMSIRTAAVLGCSDVWIIGRRKYDARPEVGAKHYIRIHKMPVLENPAAFFEEQGIQPILVEQGGSALEDTSFKPFFSKNIPVCFIMGSESHGIPAETLKNLAAAPRVSISQYGMVRSLNVSIAASIVLYEYLRQWRKDRKDI